MEFIGHKILEVNIDQIIKIREANATTQYLKKLGEVSIKGAV